MFPCAWIGTLSIIKTAVTLKAIYRFITLTIKTQAVIFAETEGQS